MKASDRPNQQNTLDIEKSDGQLLEEFAYAVSHNLSAPSRHIGRYLEMLENELASETFPQGESSQEIFARLLKVHKDLERHMAAILEYSRAGRDIPNFKVLNIGAFMETQLEAFEEQISFDYLPPQKKITASTDAFMLEEIIQELLQNAIQFCKPAQTTEVRLSIGDNTEEVFIELRDHGLGFDIRSKNRLFLLFQSLHNQQETMHQGIGVGLATISRTLRQLGGRITAEGQVDIGACFTVFLPKNPPPIRELPSFLQF